MKAMRLGTARRGVSAKARPGRMASKNGKAMAVPRPLRTVRREIWPFMDLPFLASAFLERIALDDFNHQTRKLIAFLGHLVRNPLDGGLVIKFQTTPQGIC